METGEESRTGGEVRGQHDSGCSLDASGSRLEITVTVSVTLIIDPPGRLFDARTT